MGIFDRRLEKMLHLKYFMNKRETQLDSPKRTNHILKNVDNTISKFPKLN